MASERREPATEIIQAIFVKRSLLTTHWSKSVIIRRICVICVPIAIPTHSPLTVKYFYSCPQNAYWFQNEQKPLKIVQKQT